MKIRIAAVMLVMLVVTGAGCSAPGDGQHEEQATPVTVQAIRQGSLTVQTRISGEVQPISEAAVVSKMPGRVEAVYIDIGERVAAGDVLVRLSDEDIINQVRQAEAAVDMARANVGLAESGAEAHELEMLRQQQEQSRLALEAARTNYERISHLHREGYAADRELEDVRLQLQLSESRYQTVSEQLAAAERGVRAENLQLVKAQLAQAEAGLAAARQQLAAAEITAPISGVVAVTMVRQGEQVGAGTPVVHIVDIDRVRITLALTEALINRIRAGDLVTVEVAAAGSEYLATVAAVGPAADHRTRTYPARLEIDNPDHRLKPGMYAVATLTEDRVDDAVLVPRRSVIESDGQHYLFTVRDGTAVRHTVQIGVADGNEIQIVSGVKPDELVIVSGHHYVRDGQRVRVTGGSNP